jgi:hypothetical protein
MMIAPTGVMVMIELTVVTLALGAGVADLVMLAGWL